MSRARLAAFEKEQLWRVLQALGFQPGPAAAAGAKIETHTHLGANMFDKPNHHAFEVVSYFLFQTLDQSLTKNVFKHCWPPFDQKRNAEFRKHCCEWLKKISAECGSSFPPVVGSIFLSPGGSKFIHLMYHFAKFVAVKYIKSNSKNSSTSSIEIFNEKSQNLHRCIARCHVARNRFLHTLQKQDCVTRTYQENTQFLVKQIRSLRAEYIAYQNQIQNMEPYDEQINIQEKIVKVRSLWASVIETLEFLDKEREVVSSVLSLDNNYVLDGTDVTINIPTLLIDKIGKQFKQLHIGTIYESEKLNFLTVIQLLNEVLKVMKSEYCRSNQARLTVDLNFLEKEIKFQRERLSVLKQTRHKIKEDLKTIRHSIIEKQGEWHTKWKEILGLSPFSLIRGSTSAVDILPPMSPLSFDPVSEEVYARSILTQYPALFPDAPVQQNQENDCTRNGHILGAVCDLSNSSDSFLQPASSSDRSSTKLLETDMKISIPREKNETISKSTPEFEEEDSLSLNTVKTIESSTFGGSLPAKKCDPFQKEQDHLVEEVVKTVLSDSPQSSEGREIKLEELIDSLVSNPFLTRKQIPRTPENLISEIRTSWRKAVEMDNNGSTESLQEDTEQHGKLLPESSPVLHTPKEFSVASFFSETTVSNTSQSHLCEERVVSDCLKSVPQKQVTSYINQSATSNESDLLNKKNMDKQDLNCSVSQNKQSETSQTQPFSPAVGSRKDEIGSCEGEYDKILDCSQAYQEPSMHKSVLSDSFQISRGISSSLRDTDLGILHETFPEELDNVSFNSFSSTRASFQLDPNSPVPSNIFPKDAVGEGRTTPESDFSFQAICSRKYLSNTEETSPFNLETLERHKLEMNPTFPNIQTSNKVNTLDTQDLHIDYTKPSLRMSFGERKRSLSPLIKFSPVEQRWRSTIPCSLDELYNLEEEEIQNKILDGGDPHRT
ncbi:HAUS augmin-like complex subunit 6 [Suncus etruscus]|uniref:HAUS augmin-like complex subunit 6 n=1 Tax=Suncus etruscus TaxID=109475 RepID=UPI00210FAA59|nr:HAUS augmin-like complex subunit 6 [Suncus etruscus]